MLQMHRPWNGYRVSNRTTTKCMCRRVKRRLVESHFRGLEGERCVFDTLLNYASKQEDTYGKAFHGEIRRVADDPYMGDFQWIEGDMCIHIEAKNVRKLGETTMDRFERDIWKGWTNQRIHGAICVNVDWVDCLPGANELQDVYLATVFQDAPDRAGLPIALVRDVSRRPELLYGTMDLVRQAIHSSRDPSTANNPLKKCVMFGCNPFDR